MNNDSISQSEARPRLFFNIANHDANPTHPTRSPPARYEAVKMFFPEGLTVEKSQVQTPRINQIISILFSQSSHYEKGQAEQPALRWHNQQRQMPTKIKESAGRPYRPSNGTEGMIFLSQFCHQCAHEKYHHTLDDGDKACEIYTSTLVYDLGDSEYPSEWVYDSLGNPRCTAHISWNWGNEDDGWNDPDFPIEPEPFDPGQLLIPFDITDLFGFNDPCIVVTKLAILEI